MRDFSFTHFILNQLLVFSPLKNDNLETKKRMYREKENVGTKKYNSKMYPQCTRICSRIRENNKKPIRKLKTQQMSISLALREF